MVAAIWIFTFMPVNERGLYEMMLHQLFNDRAVPGTTEEELANIAEKMVMCRRLKHEGSADGFVKLHYQKILREWKRWTDLVDRLFEECCEVVWMVDDCWLAEEHQATDVGETKSPLLSGLPYLTDACKAGRLPGSRHW